MAKQRVCLVANELLGLVKNGGIGTATSYLALTLPTQGYQVDVLLFGGHKPKLEKRWADRFAAAGVNIEFTPGDVQNHPAHLTDSTLVFEHLRKRQYDIVIFQDWLGVGFMSMNAKRAGLAFGDTVLAHICHGPVNWLREANGHLGWPADHAAIAYMERRSAEQADMIISPSRHLPQWMANAGWRLPSDIRTIPYFTEHQLKSIIDGTDFLTDRPPTAPLCELVFFGRIEERKGVKVFTDALKSLEPELLAGIEVTFLGRLATFDEDDLLDLLELPTREALKAVNFRSDYDQTRAVAYLRQPGRLAIVPSLLDNSPNTVYECIEFGIPFICSHSGGTGELVHADDAGFATFNPTPKELAERLRALLADRQPPRHPRPSYSPQASLAAWSDTLTQKADPVVVVREQPPLTVVLPYYDQPTLIAHTLDSLERQTYRNFDVLIIDDGTKSDAGREGLERMQRFPWRFELTVHRQDNTYLGAARNTGTRLARNDLIAYIDDDDQFAPTYLATMVQAYLTTGRDIVTSAFEMHETLTGPLDGEPGGRWFYLGDPAHLGLDHNCFGGAGMLLNRSVWEKVGGFHERYGLGYEDWDFFVRAAVAGFSIFALPEALYRYRLRPTSMVRTMGRMDSYQHVLDTYRSMLPATLVELVDLAIGQVNEVQKLRHELRIKAGEVSRLERVARAQDKYLYMLLHQTGARELLPKEPFLGTSSEQSRPT